MNGSRTMALLAAALGGVAAISAPAAGQSILIDFGSASGLTASDGGNTWNSFTPGQFIRLADTTGAFSGGGIPDGIGFGATTGIGQGGGPGEGLGNPDPLLLGDLAVVSATEDFVFRFDDGFADPEILGLELSSLDPNLTYTFRFFGSRVSAETRETLYTVTGGNGAQSASLITSGTNIGSDGMSFANDNEIAEINGVSPQPNGTILIEAQAIQSSFLYINAMEIRIESDVNIAFNAQPASTVVDAGGVLAFAASVSSDGGSLALQWEKDGVALSDDGRVSGATTDTLTIAQAGLDDVGVYRLVASDSGASATSDDAVGAVRRSAMGDVDFNNDGILDFFDVLDYLAAFDAAVGP